MKNKRGITELLQENLLKLIMVALITGLLILFIYYATSGEVSQAMSASREYVLWTDVAHNTDDFASTKLNLPTDYEIWFAHEKYPFLVIGKKESESAKFVSFTETYRVFENPNKEIDIEKIGPYWIINVENVK